MQESGRDLVKQIPNNFAEFTVKPEMVTPRQSVKDRNLENYFALIDNQELTGESCFFVGLYGLSAALHPDKKLPDACEYLDSIRDKYSHVLEKKRLLVRYDKISQAIGVYEEWGIKLTNLNLNNVGSALLAAHLDQRIPVTTNPSWNSLQTDNLAIPFGVLVHQPGGNNSHFVTIDGSEKTKLLFDKYLNEGFKVVATFSFENGS